VLALQYVSAFYSLLLIALTYSCVELHGHNFRLIVWLWKPFHRCFVKIRRRWDSKASVIDVFATFLLLSYSKLLFVSLFLLKGTEIHNADSVHASGTSHVLWVDATVHYLSKEHLPFAITACLTLFFISLPPILLIFYPCKVFKRCPNCCHKRSWHALHTFVEAFYGCYKEGVTGGWDFRSMSGISMFFRFLVVIINFHILYQVCWLVCALIILSLSMLILIVQPYKKSYMNVLDGLLLGLLGALMLLIVTFEFLLPSSRNETLPIIFVIACGFPQLMLLLSVTYRQLKVKLIVGYIAGKVSAWLKKIHKQNQAEDELSWANSLPHRLVNPNQYNKSLLSESEETHANFETFTVLGQVQPAYTYGSIS